MDENQLLMDIENKLKAGDFSVKSSLIKLMNHTQDTEIMSGCISLFCAVCSNEDFNNPMNLAFLEEAEEDIVHAFAADSVFILSYGVVPYLIALLETWEDSVNDESIRVALDFALSYSDVMDFEVPLEEIKDYAYEIINQADKNKYYYMNQEFHPSILAKEATGFAQRQLEENSELQMSIQANMLSFTSGQKFPLSYFDKVDEDAMRKIYDYIEKLIPISWERGSKYYYGHKIES